MLKYLVYGLIWEAVSLGFVVYTLVLMNQHQSWYATAYISIITFLWALGNEVFYFVTKEKY